MEKDQFLELLHEKQSSGLSIKAYCEAHSIALSTFYFGKHRFLSSPSSEEVSYDSLVPVHLAHPHSSVVSVSSHPPLLLHNCKIAHLCGFIALCFSKFSPQFPAQILQSIFIFFQKSAQRYNNFSRYANNFVINMRVRVFDLLCGLVL